MNNINGILHLIQVLLGQGIPFVSEELHVPIWWKWTKRLTLWGVPIILACFIICLLIGIFAKSAVPFSVLGLLVVIPLAVIMWAWLPLTLALGSVYKKIKGAEITSSGEVIAKAHLKATAVILLWVLIVSFVLTIVPYWNNWTKVFPIALTTLLLAFSAIVWQGKPWHRKMIIAVAIAVFAWNTGICFLPKTGKAICTRFNNWDISLAKSIKKGKFLENEIIALYHNVFPRKAEAKTPPPPRDTQWMSWNVDNFPTKLIKIYNGDIFEYKSPEGFWLKDEANKTYYHNPSAYPGEIRSFTFYNVKPEGEYMYIFGNGGFQMLFKIKHG